MAYIIPSSAATPGAVYQPKRRYILNRIYGAIAAWSTRRLISTAPADIARARDASTNEEDFTANELAGSGFTTLAGAGDGFYVTLYDQIGSNDATQATAASQPKGVDTGTLITDGSRPVLDFDGINDSLSIPDSNIFSFGDGSNDDPFTVSAFVNMRDASFFRIISKSLFSQGSIEWIFTADSSDKLILVVYDDNPTNRRGRQVSDPITENIWMHVAGVYDGRGGANANDGIKLFINGVRSDDGDYNLGSYTAMSNTSGNVKIGELELTGSYCNGKINDVIIFNRALSDAEVLSLYTELS